MSRLWPEQLRIGLGASYAVLARVRGRRVVDWRMQSFEPAAGELAWQAPLRCLAAWLAAIEPRGMAMKIALSAELAPLHLLPWREDITRAEQQALLAQSHFRQVFGEAVSSWKISVQAMGYRESWLASAMDVALLQALTELARSHQLRLQAVTPLTVSLFNGIRRQLKKGSGWLLMAEPAKLVALHLDQGRWQLLHTLPAAALEQEPVEQLLLREARLAGLALGPEQMYLLGLPNLQGETSGNRLASDWQAAAASDRDHLHLLGAAA